MITHFILGYLELLETGGGVGLILHITDLYAVRKRNRIGVLVVVRPESLVVKLRSRLRLVLEADDAHRQPVRDVVDGRIELHGGNHARCVRKDHAKLHEGDAALFSLLEHLGGETVFAENALVHRHVKAGALTGELTVHALAHLVVIGNEPQLGSDLVRGDILPCRPVHLGV